MSGAPITLSSCAFFGILLSSCSPSLLLQSQNQQHHPSPCPCPCPCLSCGCIVGGNSLAEVEAAPWQLCLSRSSGLSEESQANYAPPPPLNWLPGTQSSPKAPFPYHSALRYLGQYEGKLSRGMEQGVQLTIASPDTGMLLPAPWAD